MTEQKNPESHIDEQILGRMTPEGRDLARRVLESNELTITVTDGHRKSPLFPPRTVPSFIEVVGPEAMAEYTRAREDQDAQELHSRSRARAARRRGRKALGQ